MKTLVESIFDNEQTQINNSGPKLSNIKNNNDWKNWLKYYDLELNENDAKKILDEMDKHYWGDYECVKSGCATSGRNFWLAIKTTGIELGVLDGDFGSSRQKLHLALTAPKSYKKIPFYKKLTNILKEEGFKRTTYSHQADALNIFYEKKL